MTVPTQRSCFTRTIEFPLIVVSPSSVSPSDYAKIQELTNSSSDHAFKESRKQQIKKYTKITKHKTKNTPRSISTQAMGSSISLRPQYSKPMGCSVPPNQLHTKAHLRSKAAFANHTVVNLSKRTLTAEETDCDYSSTTG